MEALTDNELLVKKIKRNIELFKVCLKSNDECDEIASAFLSPDELGNDAEDLESTTKSEIKSKDCSSLMHEKQSVTERRVGQTAEQVLMRRRLQKILSNLQNEAINIVYSIDTLNDESERSDRWIASQKEMVRRRSRNIIDSVKRRERQLLSELDNSDQNASLSKEIASGKSKLQSNMRRLLSLVDFVRLLIDCNYDIEMEQYFNLIISRINSISQDSMILNKSVTELGCPKADIDACVSELFGGLKYRTEQIHTWEMPHEMWNVKNSESTVEENRMMPIEEYVSDNTGHAAPQESRDVSLFSWPSSDTDCQDTRQRVSIAECTPLTTKRRPIRLSHSFDINYNANAFDGSIPRSRAETIADDQTMTSPEGSNLSPRAQEQGSLRYQWSRGNRRHTVGDIQDEIRQNDEKWGRLFPATPSDQSRIRVRHMSDDLHRTRQMINMCKRQIAEAKTRTIPEFGRCDMDSESDALSREHFLQLRQSVKNKTSRWRRLSAD